MTANDPPGANCALVLRGCGTPENPAPGRLALRRGWGATVMTGLVVLAALVGQAASATKEASGLAKLLPRGLVDAAGKEVSRDQLKGKVIGLYFAAADNPSCQAFAPILEAFRARHVATLAVVMISRDASAPAMGQHLQALGPNWLAVPYHSPAREALWQRFEVQGVPTLVIVSDEGRVLEVNGCATLVALGDDEEAAATIIAQWRKPHAVEVFFDE